MGYDDGVDAPTLPPLPGEYGLRRRRLARALGLVGFASMTVPLMIILLLRMLGLYDGALREFFSSVGPALLAFGGPGLLIVGWWLGRARAKHGTASLVDGALHLAVGRRTRVIPPDAIAGAAHPSPTAGFVVQLRNGDELVCERAHARSDDVAALLSALGLDARRRAVTLRASASVSPAFRAAWIYVASFPAMAAAFPHAALGTRLLLVSLATAASWLLAAGSAGPTVAVGVDGMEVRRTGRARFVPWSGVERVAMEGGGLRAHLVDGETIGLGGATPGGRTLYARIEQARSVAAADAARPLPTGRQGRSVAEWRAAMGALVGASGYREGAVTE
ncbi:MAG: hypothetical protein JWM10_2777, partial [Myxococcaceae bacterium]|nr:hypothetical protein [Myxococcaceae bacterium]